MCGVCLPVAKLIVQYVQQRVLLCRPPVFSHTGVEVVRPALAALLPQPRSNHHGNFAPAGHALGFAAADSGVFLVGPLALCRKQVAVDL